jgi:uncharacterized protein involved in exopolysaccharide biosynthesis
LISKSWFAPALKCFEGAMLTSGATQSNAACLPEPSGEWTAPLGHDHWKDKAMNVHSTTSNSHEGRTEGAGMQQEWSTEKHMVEHIAGLISFFLRYKFAYVGLVSALVLSLVFLLPPKYEVSAIISLLPNKPYDVDLEKAGARPSREQRQAEAAIALLGSENLIKEAIEAVGASNMYPASADDIDKAYLSAQGALTVREEKLLSEVIQIKFRHRDPNLAVSFTNALLNSFTVRYARLNSNDRAVAFYVYQQQQNRTELEKAEKTLYDFSSANRIFNISEQIVHLIDERSSQVTSLSDTKGLIARKEAEESEIPTQLARMKPFSRYPQIKEMISATRAETSSSGISSRTNGKRRNGSSANADKQSSEGAVNIDEGAVNIDKEKINKAFSGSDPPLLLVRLYQETIASLVKTQIELDGLRALEAHQGSALKKIEGELDLIASKQAQFDRLQKETDYKKAVDKAYTEKIIELKVSHKLGADNLSNVDIIQQATVPRESTRRWYVALIGIALCLAPFLAIFVFRHWPGKSLIVSEDDARSEDGPGAGLASGKSPSLTDLALREIPERIVGRAW